MRLRRCRPKPDIIEIDSNLSVRFWMQELMVSRVRLFSAIDAVGCEASAVRDFLAADDAISTDLSDAPSPHQEASGHMQDSEPVYSVQYVSRASPGLTSADVDAILSWSRMYNRSEGITGVLLFTGTHFSQILEGPAEAVHRLLSSIRIDTRHRDVRVVVDGATANRCFHDWSMAWVEDFGLRDLLEELWWVATRDDEAAGKRAARLVQHLRHAVVDGGLASMQGDKTSSPPSSSEMQTR